MFLNPNLKYYNLLCLHLNNPCPHNFVSANGSKTVFVITTVRIRVVQCISSYPPTSEWGCRSRGAIMQPRSLSNLSSFFAFFNNYNGLPLGSVRPHYYQGMYPFLYFKAVLSSSDAGPRNVRASSPNLSGGVGGKIPSLLHGSHYANSEITCIAVSPEIPGVFTSHALQQVAQHRH